MMGGKKKIVLCLLSSFLSSIYVSHKTEVFFFGDVF